MELPVCKHRTLLDPPLMRCASPRMIGDPRKRPNYKVDSCVACALADVDGPPAPAPMEGVDLEALARLRYAPALGRPACVHEGPILETCSSCGNDGKLAELRHIRDCDLHDRCVRDRRAGRFIDNLASCHDCPDYSDGLAPVDRPNFASGPAANAGVVIGCYGWPQLTEIQIRTIRELCGPVPLLVADDGSPATGDLARLCERYDDVEFAGSLRRLGHYAGDLSVFRKGLEWANSRRLDVLVKLSQRLIFTTPGWLRAAIEPIEAGRTETVVSGCIDLGTNLYVRSEAMAVLVEAWSAAAVMERLSADALGQPTELLINDIIVRQLAGRRLPWPSLPPDRDQAAAGTIWHCTHGAGDYVAWGRRYNLALDADFSTAGRQRLAGWVRG
jgi:hypothetical protein